MGTRAMVIGQSWRGLAGRTSLAKVGSWVASPPWRWRFRCHGQRTPPGTLRRGWQRLRVPSLQLTSCAETAKSLAEEFGHWGPISWEEALSTHPGTPPSLQ